MGGCCSKTEAPSGGKAASAVRRRRSPPPPPESEGPQEETVKEVLSETPKPRARPREEGVEEEEAGFDEVSKGAPGGNPVNGGYDERSEESSEVCSMSEGCSASKMATEKRAGEEGEAEGGARGAREESSPAKLQRKRSVSGEIPRRKERRGAAVGWRSSPSPVRRREGGVGRTYSTREAGQGKAAARSWVPAGDGFRRDPGERSGRRSVSPAGKRAAELRGAAAGGQCRMVPASRANGRASPLRIPLQASADEDGRMAERASSGEGKESLENPLVSLECFIFL